jgi:hypothetical protein
MSEYRNAYTTLAIMRTSKDIVSNADDSMLVNYIYSASKMIDRDTDRSFAPFYAERSIDIDDVQLLTLDEDLLVLNECRLGNDVINPALFAQRPDNTYPKRTFARYNTAWTWTTSPLQAITVSGIWGYHRNPARMFAAFGAIDGVIDDTETVIPLKASAGISYPSLIRVDSEYMLVTGVSGDELTVVRGSNGTDSTSHSDDTTVSLYIPLEDVTVACTTLALYLYETRDNFGERVASMDGTFSISKLFPQTVVNTLYGRRRHVWHTP